MSTTFFTVVWQYMQLWEKLKGEDEGAKHRMPPSSTTRTNPHNAVFTLISVHNTILLPSAIPKRGSKVTSFYLSSYWRIHPQPPKLPQESSGCLTW